MTVTQILDTMDEIETYYIQCYASATAGGKAERRFARYIAAVKEGKEIIRQHKAAENKEEKHDH